MEGSLLCCLDEDVAKLPMGYLTKVSPLGAPLSAGQRQRLTIARALYAKPKVLILDEATCHLDSSIEAKVLDNVRSLGITTVLVTHRTELVKRADRVFYLSSGRLERVETSLREDVALSY